MPNKPLKRYKALQPLSKEHHHGLLLSWKLRMGFKKNIEIERMKTYADWFYQTHLIPQSFRFNRRRIRTTHSV